MGSWNGTRNSCEVISKFKLFLYSWCFPEDFWSSYDCRIHLSKWGFSCSLSRHIGSPRSCWLLSLKWSEVLEHVNQFLSIERNVFLLFVYESEKVISHFHIFSSELIRSNCYKSMGHHPGTLCKCCALIKKFSKILSKTVVTKMHVTQKLQNYSYAQRCLWSSCSHANHVLKMLSTAAATDGCHPGSMEAWLGEKFVSDWFLPHEFFPKLV